MNFSEKMIAHKLRSWNAADAEDKAAKAALVEANNLEKLHPGKAAEPFRKAETARLHEEARRHGIESKIHMRRADLLNEGFLPTGKDESEDPTWMQAVQPIFGEAHAAGITRSSGDRLRDWT